MLADIARRSIRKQCIRLHLNESGSTAAVNVLCRRYLQRRCGFQGSAQHRVGKEELQAYLSGRASAGPSRVHSLQVPLLILQACLLVGFCRAAYITAEYAARMLISIEVALMCSAAFMSSWWAFGRVDVTRIWQPEHNQISLRWQFHGVPRIPWEVQGVFDGVSIFKLDRCVFVWQGSRFGSAGSDPCCLVPLCAAFVQMSDQAFEATRLIMKSWEGSSG